MEVSTNFWGFSGIQILLLLVDLIGITNFSLFTIIALRLTCNSIEKKFHNMWINFGKFIERPIFVCSDTVPEDYRAKIIKIGDKLQDHNILYVYNNNIQCWGIPGI